MSTDCWLVCDGHVLASATRADTARERGRGLLGRDGIDGAIVLPQTRWVHSIGMRFDIDVAYLGHDGRVVKVAQLRRNRLPAPVRRAATVVEAEAGSFERWGLRAGDVIEVRT